VEVYLFGFFWREDADVFWFLGGRERLVWVMWERFLDWGFSRCVCRIRQLVFDLVSTSL